MHLQCLKKIKRRVVMKNPKRRSSVISAMKWGTMLVSVKAESVEKVEEPEDKDTCDCPFVGEQKGSAKKPMVVRHAGLSFGSIREVKSAHRKRSGLPTVGHQRV